jgi:hypothetical protein
MTTPTKSIRALLALFLVLAAGLLLLSSSTASAAPFVGKDGKVHACYKAKGKKKGTLRMVRSAKVRCPRQWRKVSWYLAPPAGPRGEAGAAGPAGERGLTGAAGSPVVVELESKVSELLTRVQQLEGALCEQTEDLTTQANALLSSVGGLNSLLDTLLVLFDPVGLPEALPSFTCPSS